MPPSYHALGMTPTRVRMVFTDPMLADAAFLNPASYTVQDLQGVVLPILTAIPEQALHPESVILTLATPMRTTRWYETTISGALQTEALVTPTPLTTSFQFVQPAANFDVDLDAFTGEVSGGLFGNPAGLVFFSPALQTSIPNSVLQVDQVDCCTTAYDQYTPPAPLDPASFFTWSPSGPHTTLGQQGVSLWAPFPRLMEARFELTFPATSMVDLMPPASDGSCSILMRETWAHAFVALLNNPAWRLWDNTSMLVPPLFICAQNNAGPIPPGPESITVLHQSLVANSAVQADAHLSIGLTAHMTANSIMGDATHPTVAIVGHASVQAALTTHPAPSAAITASSSVAANMTIQHPLSAGITAGASIAANLTWHPFLP